MNILDSSVSGTNLVVSLDEEVLADIIWTYANDWPAVLDFIANFAHAFGLIVNKKRVAEIIQSKIGEE